MKMDIEEAEFELVPGTLIGGSHPCYIIAEIGQNHQGDQRMAEKLIKAAKEAGANCVKFQKSNLKSRFTEERLKQRYEGCNSFGYDYKEHKEKLELSERAYAELQNYASSIGIHFTASGMDKPSVDFLNSLNVPFFKIGSADTTNIPLLRHVCQYQKPILISTGMTEEVDLIKVYEQISRLNSRIVIMQCTSCYPTSYQDVNLNVIKTYKDLFQKAVIGYSGHELGSEISTAAVAIGAKVLERHITLDRSLKGSDHCSSLDPSQFAQLVNAVRKIEKAMGSPEKKFLESEMFCYKKLGKTIVTSRDLPRGVPIEEDMIDVKVALEVGMDPIMFYDIIGKCLKRDYRKEETVKVEDLVDVINLGV